MFERLFLFEVETRGLILGLLEKPVGEVAHRELGLGAVESSEGFAEGGTQRGL